MKHIVTLLVYEMFLSLSLVVYSFLFQSFRYSGVVVTTLVFQAGRPGLKP